ncbi:NAD(P)/FAD-dependent oxidoreductase [Acidipila rosea]|uniref:UDP-galactopyranose mutase n=1 Tax=Acidipila rosea TaxID=768535 RepID=A0A4R1L3X0_9BACT|nr:NAD(P)/FAD-dependent oxidoreductase [Acidipila rosea]TCK70899.1 UDP-galactopyranose mutase [Acidipila rosea]
MPTKQNAVIIGAGPAGLTAALEFVRRSEIQPIVLEASHEIGGISRTIRHNGNRMDIGGHRFFSKSDRVMNWWTALLPVAACESGDNHSIQYQNKQRTVATGQASAENTDLVMLVRPRKSRIYFLRSFFDYPLALNAKTLKQLGAWRTLKIGISYLAARLFPRKNETTLEDFLINRFGRELYLTFFKSYTEKVWGVPCDHISAEWGAQRIKGLSLRTAVLHFLKTTFSKKKPTDLSQKGTETSLIEKFLYPKYGPGQLWEHAADLVTQGGGELHMGWRVTALHVEGNRIASVEATSHSGDRRTFRADYVFSTMPVRELIRSLDVEIPAEIKQISDGLIYRDFVTVGLLVNKLTVTEPDGSPLKDTWIYIQEPDVLVGRLQIFNNWSPYMVADPDKTWIGLEYFCYDRDDLWKMQDEDLKKFAIAEIEKIGILKAADVLDAHVVRVPKTYPAYFGTYDRFDEIIRYMERFENLFLVGRNGMHKYNNQDHSMLTAMTAVDGILSGNLDKKVLWEINTEQEYHEEKK